MLVERAEELYEPFSTQAIDFTDRDLLRHPSPVRWISSRSLLYRVGLRLPPAPPNFADSPCASTLILTSPAPASRAASTTSLAASSASPRLPASTVVSGPASWIGRPEAFAARTPASFCFCGAFAPRTEGRIVISTLSSA